MPSCFFPRVAAVFILATVLSVPEPVMAADSLAGQLLVASPGMSDPSFAGTVILMVRHDSTGAMGIVINRPVADVFQYAADPDNAPLWYVNIKSVEWMTPRPAQIGSKVDFVAHFLGRRLAYTYEFVELVPGKRLTMRTPGPPFPMETRYTWEAENGATRMTLRNRGTPRGFAIGLAPLMSFMIGRANRKDLALLKQRLEQATR